MIFHSVTVFTAALVSIFLLCTQTNDCIWNYNLVKEELKRLFFLSSNATVKFRYSKRVLKIIAKNDWDRKYFPRKQHICDNTNADRLHKLLSVSLVVETLDITKQTIESNIRYVYHWVARLSVWFEAITLRLPVL